MAYYSKDRTFTDSIHKHLAFPCIYTPLGWKESSIDPKLLKELDLRCGIDYVLETSEGRRITIQERFRDSSYQNFNDCTLRYRRDQNAKESRKRSEYYKLKADYLVYGITNGNKTDESPTDFIKFVVLDLKVLRQLFSENKILIPETNQKTSSANTPNQTLTTGRMMNKDFSSDFLIFSIPQLQQLFGNKNIIIFQKGFF